MKQPIKKKILETHNISREPTIRTLLFDMNSVMKMAMVDDRFGNNGKQCGMIFQTLIVFKRLLALRDWNFVYAMYDGEQSGVLRYNFYPQYKANRGKHYVGDNDLKSDYDKALDEYCRKVLAYSKNKQSFKEKARNETEEESFERQREILFAILENLFIRQIICDKVEGDDLIAMYVKNKKPNEKICIVSGDRDLTQLINDDVCIYITQTRDIITKENHLKKMGFTHENVALKKIFCGDASDNIFGIKGLGETSFFKFFPEAKEEKKTIGDIIERAKLLNEERVKEKKKPLQVLENIANHITLGCQGDKIYEVNDRLINLNEPLLTKEAKEELEMMSYAPLDPEGREFKNVFRILQEEGMTNLIQEEQFGNFFSQFKQLVENEKRYFTGN